MVLSQRQTAVAQLSSQRTAVATRRTWAYVESVGRGQEFVFNADYIPEVDAWLHSLFDS